MRTIPHHVCFVIPPHILRNIAGAGSAAADAELRHGAQETIDTMQALIEERAHPLLLPGRATRRRKRSIYDARHGLVLPGKLVLNEKKKRAGDDETLEAWDGCGLTYDFFAEVFARNSIDGRGLRMQSTVHYGKRFDNAFWNGRQMIYGDGDGKLFRRFTGALDVIGHELTHGVTQYAAALGYRGQNGALNEHLSDTFGMMLKQWSQHLSPRQSNWIIGEGLFTKSVNGKGIRSMAAPGTAYDDPILGKDPQPSHMSGYVETAEDNGGIHINSGIPNHAFYLAAMAIGDDAWTTLGKVWYLTMSTRLHADAQFDDFAAATVDVAGELYGIFGTEQRAIADAWEAVGLPMTVVPSPQVRAPQVPAMSFLGMPRVPVPVPALPGFTCPPPAPTSTMNARIAGGLS
ncbi:MAG: Peptidase [Acidobacteria bacterium]|nr:Peptidase [Acidobacteriota bacterium]